MRRFQELLLSVWREACRHIEIAECVARMAPILAEDLPAEMVLVRRIDLARLCVETVAAGQCRTGHGSLRARNECTPEELERLLRWCRQGEVLHVRGEGHNSAPQGLAPLGFAGEFLAGPLNDQEGPSGVLLLLAEPTTPFATEHATVMGELLEPFSVALENDSRLREMSTLREAAEADKRSLLSRLGRQDIADTIVGVQAGLRHVMERVELVAHSDVPVLIFGETGSGKEVIARTIHARSRRANGPVMRVNCGALPPELIDSELFGHERGSFTGATAMRKGWFERADRGTLFLDEVGELPPAAQVRLLRILQDGTFERVGGQQQLTVDVRIIAATNRNLQSMTADGRFREDLWYRLAVFPIHLPALRDRIEDIPELAAHFALRAARRFGTRALTPTPEDLHAMLSYSWPGNVRELQTVMDRAVILGNGRQLEVAKALGATTQPPPPPAGASPSPVSPTQPAPTTATLDEVATRHIEAVLATTHGQIEGPRGAANVLGINPHTLRARMRKLGIVWKRFRR